MGLFVVERRLPAVTAAQLALVHRSVASAALRSSARGEAVRYLGCVYLPGRRSCLCRFEAADSGLVRRVNELAQAPFHRIDEAIELPAGDHTLEGSTCEL